MPGKTLKIGILSLGCPRNLVDSEAILSRLDLKGYQLVDISQADIAIVNTCSFIEEAKKESIAAILDVAQLKKEGKLKKIIVHGCLPERYRDTLARELPEVDAFVGKALLDCSHNRVSLTPRHFAYLKICEGCVNSCSYCVIPRIKGKLASLELDTLVERAKLFDQSGVRELNIVGQDITGYGLDLYGGRKLAELLKKILKGAKNIRWFRLLYLYPGKAVDELLEIIAGEERVCKYIDLPLQHINNRILKLMRRRTEKKELLQLIDRIRKKLPSAAIRTSLITGFPSETEGEFKELLGFIKEQKFERLGVFIYSREEGTPAFHLKRQIPGKVKSARFNALMLAQQEVSRENNAKLLGKKLDVLIDESEDGAYIGRSEYDAPEVDGQVYVHSKKELRPGDFVKAKITDTMEYDLVGDPALPEGPGKE